MARTPTSLDCSVCLESLNAEAKTFFELEACRHAFHYECIQNWTLKEGRVECPVCRSAVTGNDHRKLLLDKPSKNSKYHKNFNSSAPHLSESNRTYLSGMLQVAELFCPLETEMCILPIKSTLNRVDTNSSVDEFYDRAVHSEPDSATKLDEVIDRLARLVNSTLERIRHDFGFKFYWFLFAWTSLNNIYYRLPIAIDLLNIDSIRSRSSAEIPVERIPLDRNSLSHDIDISMQNLQLTSPEEYAFMIEWLNPQNDRLQLVWNKFRAMPRKERKTSDGD